MKKTILAVATCLSLFSCKKRNEYLAHLFHADDVAIGGGNARTLIETDDANLVKSVSISFDKQVFAALPHDDSNMGHEYSYKLNLPAQKSGTPFDHIVVDWNPHGHPPEHVYDLPHFDLHFYMMSEGERDAIPEYEEDSTGFLKYPGEVYMPAEYVPIPGGEAKMGTHWVDITSPEVVRSNPQTFTQTFIYGTYNGAVAFYEPMATLSYLTNTKAYTRDIPQPQKFAKTGYYPTKMSFTDKGSTMDVTLHDFVYHAKS